MSTNSVDLSAINAGLSVLSVACGAVASVMLLPGEGKRADATTRMYATSAGSFAVFTLPFGIAELPAAGLEVPTDLLSSAVKGSGEGTIVLQAANGSYELNIKVGRLTTNIVGSMYSGSVDLSLPQGDHVQQVALTQPLMNYLNAVLPALKIERTHAQLPEVVAAIRINEKGTWAATFDPYQFAWATRKRSASDDLPNITLSLPYDRMSTLVKDLPVTNCTLHLTPEVLAVKGRGFMLSIALPVVDADSALDPDAAYARSRELDKSGGDAVTLNLEEVKAYLDRSRALLASGTTVDFKPGKASAALTIQSPRGSTTLQLKGTKLARSFNIDYRYLGVVLRIGGGQKSKKGDEDVSQVEMLVSDDGSMLICRGAVNYVGWLSSAESAE